MRRRLERGHDLRVLHLIPTLTGGGAERQLDYLSHELVRRGHDVRVGYIREGFGAWPHAEVPAVQLPLWGRWDPRQLTSVGSLVHRWRPDLVHTWIMQMDVVGGLAAGATRTPWVLHEPTTASFYDRSMRAKLRLGIARAAADAVVANSEGGLAYWRKRAPGLDRRIIANAVPVEEIDRAEPFNSSRRTGIFIGRLVKMKNVDVALRAVAQVMRESDLDFVVCGEGPERPRLERIARDLRIAGRRVHFTGYTPDVWRYLKAAAFFLSLSDFEGSPNTVTEAFAARVPAILSDIPAHRELADESIATFVPLRDVDATASAIRRVAVSPAVERARARVESLTVARMTDAYEAVYQDVTSRRR